MNCTKKIWRLLVMFLSVAFNIGISGPCTFDAKIKFTNCRNVSCLSAVHAIKSQAYFCNSSKLSVNAN